MTAPPPISAPLIAPLIAVVGTDGSGKSSVTAALLPWMEALRPTRLHHLGKQTGHLGRAIARWPLFGRRLDRTIARKAGLGREAEPPGALAAIVIFAFSMRRVRRFRRMLADRAAGYAILADRFPQLGVPGPMDGLGLTRARPSVLSRRLADAERRRYAWMEGFAPDLVIRLNVDLATALARKPDHRRSSLQLKIEQVPLLGFAGAPIVDIDATLPLAEVIARAQEAIATVLRA